MKFLRLATILLILSSKTLFCSDPRFALVRMSELERDMRRYGYEIGNLLREDLGKNDSCPICKESITGRRTIIACDRYRDILLFDHSEKRYDGSGVIPVGSNGLDMGCPITQKLYKEFKEQLSSK